MGSLHLRLTTMKSFIAFSCFVAFAAANSCDSCTALVTVLSNALTSEESIANQINVLVGGLCPTSDNEDECVEKMPEFWGPLRKFSGLDTIILQPTGCVGHSAKIQWKVI